MLGKQIGDTIKVTTPAGDEQYEVIDIQYNQSEKS
jgi:transcription elongation GreA/GreB family factor